MGCQMSIPQPHRTPETEKRTRFSLRERVRKRLEEQRDKQRATRASNLDEGLRQLNQRLGFTRSQRTDHDVAGAVKVGPTQAQARSLYYSSDLDGYAEPGEVVWVTVPSTPPQHRSMLVVGRNRHDVVGLLISSNPEHAGEENWLAIGKGEWDATTDQCWLRLDKALSVPETDITRRGILFPRRRFEVVAGRLRSGFHWS